MRGTRLKIQLPVMGVLRQAHQVVVLLLPVVHQPAHLVHRAVAQAPRVLAPVVEVLIARGFRYIRLTVFGKPQLMAQPHVMETR